MRMSSLNKAPFSKKTEVMVTPLSPCHQSELENLVSPRAQLRHPHQICQQSRKIPGPGVAGTGEV